MTISASASTPSWTRPQPGLEEALREHLAKHLVHYKIPRSFEFVSEPLRDDAGKVRRSALRAARLPR